jgi:hypothetical protein
MNVSDRGITRIGSSAGHRVLSVRRLGREVRALQIPVGRKSEMKCDICDQEFANSEAVKAHKEREHPMGVEKDVENPDVMDKPESEPVEPEVVVRPVR